MSTTTVKQSTRRAARATGFASARRVRPGAFHAPAADAHDLADLVAGLAGVRDRGWQVFHTRFCLGTLAVAAALDMSHDTYRKAKAVTEAANGYPNSMDTATLKPYVWNETAQQWTNLAAWNALMPDRVSDFRRAWDDNLAAADYVDDGCVYFRWQMTGTMTVNHDSGCIT